MLTRVLTVSTSGNDHQANTVGKSWSVLDLNSNTGVKMWLDESGKESM